MFDTHAIGRDSSFVLEKSGTKCHDKTINGAPRVSRRSSNNLLYQAQFGPERTGAPMETHGANWIELSGNTESISRHAAPTVRHNYIRLKAQHAPDPATYVVVGYTRMYSDSYRRSANSTWSMEDPAIYNAFSCDHPSWHTRARYTYAYTGTCMHVYAHIYFRMASRT